MSDDSSEPWDGVVTTEALRAWARRVPDSADGTERLCLAVYGRPAQPRDFLGGSQAHMLHDAADKIAALKAVVDAAREACLDAELPNGRAYHGAEKHTDEWHDGFEVACRLWLRGPLRSALDAFDDEGSQR